MLLFVQSRIRQLNHRRTIENSGLGEYNIRKGTYTGEVPSIGYNPKRHPKQGKRKNIRTGTTNTKTKEASLSNKNKSADTAAYNTGVQYSRRENFSTRYNNSLLTEEKIAVKLQYSRSREGGYCCRIIVNSNFTIQFFSFVFYKVWLWK